MPAEVTSGALLMTRSVAAMTATALLCWSLTRRSAIRAADAEGAGTPLAAILDAGRPRFALRLHHGVLLAVLAGVFDMLGHIGYVSAAVDGNMGVAAALVALFPAVSVVLAILFLNERISRNQAIGFACSIAGVFMLAD
jgi:drug/metabolite transporter (DMT)-like permease